MGLDQDTLVQLMQEMASLPPDQLAAMMEEPDQEAGELSDGHLVNYTEECIRHCFDSNRERRTKWDHLWEAHESQIREYGAKEEWQNAIILPKPFTTTVTAKSIVRRAMIERPDYFSLEATNKQDPEKMLKASFWQKGLKYWLGTKDAHLPTVFADAAEMGFVVGVSSGVKILWRPDDNGVFRLVYQNIPAWNLFADPDREPRKPQSGLYMIHQEWVPMDTLYSMQEQGYYENVDMVVSGRQYTDAAGYTQEDQEDAQRRRGQLHRHRYRKYACVNEFWGGVLNESGRLVLPNCRFTVANGVVIKRPKRVPFMRLRWPIVQFSPIPHLMRFEGYGLWEHVMSMWHFQNNLLNLYGDNENWRIQNMFELDPSKLEDPQDRSVYPGKLWTRKRGSMDNGNRAIQAIEKGESNLQDVNFMWELSQREWEEGSFVTQPLKGVGGEESQEQTLGQSQMQMSASKGVFDSFGTDIECGGVDIITGTREVLETFWDPMDSPQMAEIFGRNSHELAMMELNGFLMPEARMQAMAVDADIKVSGISRLLEQDDQLRRLTLWIQTSADPRYTLYAKDFETIKRLADEIRMPELCATEEEAVQIQYQQQLQGLVDRAVNTADPTAQGRPTGQSEPPAGTGGPPPPPMG